MATYAPVYRLTKSQKSFITREARSLKVKAQEAEPGRQGDDESGIEEPVEEEIPDSLIHPVSRTDPYWIAQYPREWPLPPHPFPHAPVKDAASRPVSEAQIDQQLAAFKPALFRPPRAQDGSTLKRQHLDNLTTLLHKCVLNNDWNRASKIWALILRTKISGATIDLRNNGYWALTAEMLMRRSSSQSSVGDVDRAGNGITVEGLFAAKIFYERLILQYPHTTSLRHPDALNAKTIYPCMFNIWIYAVQLRSKQAREIDDHGSSSSRADLYTTRVAREEEVGEADQILVRMNELMRGPPYDRDREMMHMRAMVTLWIADLYAILADLVRDIEEEASNGDEPREGMSSEVQELLSKSQEHQAMADELLSLEAEYDI